jgi:hypothetical protein
MPSCDSRVVCSRARSQGAIQESRNVLPVPGFPLGRLLRPLWDKLCSDPSMPRFGFTLLHVARATLCVPLFALVSLTSSAQQTPRINQLSPLTLPAREALARPLILHAEATASTFDPPSRSLLLYRSAGAWLPLDHSRAVRVYRESFAAARESAPTIRHYLEEAILNDLLPLSPSDVLDLLPGAETATQARLYGALVNFAIFQSDYAMAVHVFEHATSAGVLPLRATDHLFASLPVSASAERTRIFASAVRYYETHPNSEPWHWTVADLVGRFYKQVREDSVLQAIHIALAQAEQQDKKQAPGMISMGAQEHHLIFHSEYDFQLFAVAPALEQMDPALAAKLLAQHAEAAANLTRFPQGLVSFYEGDSSFGNPVLVPNHQKPDGLRLYNVEEPQNLNPLDMGLEFTIPRNLNILGVTGSLVSYAQPGSPEASVVGVFGSDLSCPADLAHSFELATAVPALRKVATSCGGPLGGQWCSYADTFPRGSVIQLIAERCTYYGEPAKARAALEKEIELVDQIPEEHQIEYLATAADLYLRLSDHEAAARVVQKGFTAARTLFDCEVLSPRLQGYPKGIWNSAEAYRRMSTLGVNASVDSTLKAISEIPDSGLRELERVMIARALLGVPVRRNMTVNESGTFCTTEAEVTYDQF